MDRPLIFITNDDGINAAGLHKLAKIASGFGDVVVGAPDAPQSGKSSALTVNGALELIAHPSEDGVRIFSITGTPVDCVKVAMHAILDRKPDLILSGINHGSNAAVNNIYSGTMGAAMEGCIIGIPSVGFSLLDHSPKADFEPLAPFVADIIRRVLAEGLPKDICLNVNFPAGCTPEGVKVVRAARGHWTEEYSDYTSPHGRPFYWLTGKFHNDEPGNPDTDEYWLARNYGTVVPIRPDQTAADQIEAIKSLID
ncbi:5'/3'-nucleotidase SurE [Duncaniella freteri]|uniref:5'/3'-nucleotidase SurE n=1 Tax=Duncaniella freteri TaxID=2530391 RepID=UPI0025881AEC|nr:5'/3'-nucleotidase SurE [Duncaniella freteri]